MLGEARDEANFDRIGTDKENNGNRFGGSLGSQRSWCAGPGNNDCYLSANKIRGQRRQPIVVTLRPQVFDCYIAAIGESGVRQAVLKRDDILAHRFKSCTAEEADHWQSRVLCTGSRRPGDRRTT